MRRMLTLIRDLMAAQPPRPHDPLRHMTPRELSDLPPYHPRYARD